MLRTLIYAFFNPLPFSHVWHFCISVLCCLIGEIKIYNKACNGRSGSSEIIDFGTVESDYTTFYWSLIATFVPLFYLVRYRIKDTAALRSKMPICALSL